MTAVDAMNPIGERTEMRRITEFFGHHFGVCLLLTPGFRRFFAKEWRESSSTHRLSLMMEMLTSFVSTTVAVVLVVLLVRWLLR